MPNGGHMSADDFITALFIAPGNHLVFGFRAGSNTTGRFCQTFYALFYSVINDTGNALRQIDKHGRVGERFGKDRDGRGSGRKGSKVLAWFIQVTDWIRTEIRLCLNKGWLSSQQLCSARLGHTGPHTFSITRCL
ncbi:hypothetical protein AMECASPLE_002876 [Ameca splendens]|uniref:Uncharacterized protein n=1 Tax=Ameca splendens TaxID=208324 RepID=A0ABV1A619_9TELE